MKNKAKLAFDLLEQEMEVICKEDQIRFIGGSGGYTWQQIVDAINSGNISQIPAGSYIMNSENSFSYWGGELNEVIVFNKTAANGSSSGFSGWDLTNTSTGGTGSFWLSSGGYVDGGGGSTGSGSSSSTGDFSGYTPMQIIDVLNSAGGITTNWTAAASDIFKLETSMFRVASASFGVLDIVLNAREMYYGGLNWEDTGQIALAGVLLVPGLNVTVAVAGGVVLLSWEMYEANNP